MLLVYSTTPASVFIKKIFVGADTHAIVRQTKDKAQDKEVYSRVKDTIIDSYILVGNTIPYSYCGMSIQGIDLIMGLARKEANLYIG
jgi:hypothetical protein